MNLPSNDVNQDKRIWIALMMFMGFIIYLVTRLPL